MKVSREGLKVLLKDNILEIRFTRRHQKGGQAPSRRMICTNSKSLLDNIGGKIALKFDPPHGPPKYDPNQHNLVFAWDIMMSQYRAIPLEGHDIVAIMPLKTKEDMDKFWQYFTQFLAKLKPQERLGFGNT